MDFGIDSHKQTLALVGIDERGRDVCHASFANTARGHRELWRFARQHTASGACRFGIEGSGGYGRALAVWLVEQGEHVVEVPGVLTERQRRHSATRGKSDLTDALAIARVVAREEYLPEVRPDDASYELRLLVDYRDQLTRERFRTSNRLHADLVRLRPGYHQHCPNLVAKKHQASARRLLRGDASIHAHLARQRLQALARHDAELADIDKRIAKLLAETGTRLTDICGVGQLVAARILGEVGNIRRFPTRDRFAAACGVCPVPASSGSTHRHRLNRGGNRRLNRALYTIAIVQARLDPRARAYLERRRSEGRTWREAIRCLKRHLADVIYRALRAEQPLPPAATTPRLDR
jgi:transposase